MEPRGNSRGRLQGNGAHGRRPTARQQAVEVVDFNDPTAGKTGPFAIQIHNKGLFDEYKDLTVEVDPKDDELITVK
jgi:hypothetical protein